MQGVWYIPSTAIGLVLLMRSGLSAWLSGGLPDLSTYDPATRHGTPK
jgi:hypothetical protein